MHIRKNVNIASFIKTVGQCHGEVSFQTNEGDVLNLSSVLSRYIFATIAENPEILYASQIVCELDADRKLLGSFLTDEGKK